ncbi:MAG: tetratricopeptide repeat protein [Anaerolineales bacterium]
MSNFLNETQQLNRLVRLVLAALVGLTLAFAGYYYWDRYVHLGDKPLLEMGTDRLEAEVISDPSSPESRLALAEIKLSNSQYDEAINQAGQVLKTYPDNQRGLLVVGLAHALNGNPASAIDPLSRFVSSRKQEDMWEQDKTLETALYYLADSYLKSGNTNQAIAALEDALVISPADADALYLSGTAHAREARYEEALEYYRGAVRLDPSFGEAYAAMGEAYTALQKPQYVSYTKGMQAYTVKDYATAKNYLTLAAANLPDFAPAFLGLGLTLEQTGDLSEAEVYLERAANLDPLDFMTSNALEHVRALLADK